MTYLSTNLGLTTIPENSDPKDLLEFIKIYNAINQLAQALDNYTSPITKQQGDWPSLPPANTILWQNACRMYCLFTDTVTAGQVVNLWNSGGVAARLANASTPQYCHGYAPAAVTAGNFGEVILKGAVVINGLTPGTKYYLSTTAGSIQAAAPTNVQVVGFAVDTNILMFDPQILGN